MSTEELSPADREEIVRFLDGSLSNSQLKDFNEKLKTNTAFQREFACFLLQDIQLSKIGKESITNIAPVPRRSAIFRNGPVRKSQNVSVWLALASSIALLLGGFLYLNRQQSAQPVEHARVIGILQKANNAGVSRAGERLTPESRFKILENDIVQTGENGNAHLEYPDKTMVRISTHSEIKLTQRDDAKQVEIVRGLLSANVAKQPEGQFMTFVSRLGTAKVLGTRLNVSVSDVSMRLEVQEGKVELIRKRDGKSVVVSTGHFAVIDSEDSFQVKPLLRVPMPSDSGIIVGALSAGSTHSVALKDDGTVWTWGSNSHGQLGIGSTNASLVPVLVKGLSGISEVSAGGSNLGDYTIVLKEDGTLWAWGDNTYGQLGDGTTQQRNSPVQVANGLNNIVSVKAGSFHTLALKSDGTVWAWGSNGHGQLGDGMTADKKARKLTPVQVIGLSDVVEIEAGSQHTLALKSDGTVWASGFNSMGQLGEGTKIQRNQPVQVTGLSEIIQIAAGGYHGMALKSDDTVWAWGSNSEGQLGDGTTTQRLTPVQITSLSRIVDISGGGIHSLALKADGTVWGWGSNRNGSLGDGTFITRKTPVQIGLPYRPVAIAGGIYYSMFLLPNGTIWNCGSNVQGQLGDGTQINRSRLGQVIGLDLIE